MSYCSVHIRGKMLEETHYLKNFVNELILVYTYVPLAPLTYYSVLSVTLTTAVKVKPSHCFLLWTSSFLLPRTWRATTLYILCVSPLQTKALHKPETRFSQLKLYGWPMEQKKKKQKTVTFICLVFFISLYVSSINLELCIFCLRQSVCLNLNNDNNTMKNPAKKEG